MKVDDLVIPAIAVALATPAGCTPPVYTGDTDALVPASSTSGGIETAWGPETTGEPNTGGQDEGHSCGGTDYTVHMTPGLACHHDALKVLGTVTTLLEPGPASDAPAVCRIRTQGPIELDESIGRLAEVCPTVYPAGEGAACDPAVLTAADVPLDAALGLPIAEEPLNNPAGAPEAIVVIMDALGPKDQVDGTGGCEATIAGQVEAGRLEHRRAQHARGVCHMLDRSLGPDVDRVEVKFLPVLNAAGPRGTIADWVEAHQVLLDEIARTNPGVDVLSVNPLAWRDFEGSGVEPADVERILTLLGEAGVVVLGATGNAQNFDCEGPEGGVVYPARLAAAYSFVVPVSATDYSGHMSAITRNHGKAGVAAPGQLLLSGPRGCEFLSGTSFSVGGFSGGLVRLGLHERRRSRLARKQQTGEPAHAPALNDRLPVLIQTIYQTGSVVFQGAGAAGADIGHHGIHPGDTVRSLDTCLALNAVGGDLECRTEGAPSGFGGNDGPVELAGTVQGFDPMKPAKHVAKDPNHASPRTEGLLFGNMLREFDPTPNIGIGTCNPVKSPLNLQFAPQDFDAICISLSGAVVNPTPPRGAICPRCVETSAAPGETSVYLEVDPDSLPTEGERTCVLEVNEGELTSQALDIAALIAPGGVVYTFLTPDRLERLLLTCKVGRTLLFRQPIAADTFPHAALFLGKSEKLCG